MMKVIDSTDFICSKIDECIDGWVVTGREYFLKIARRWYEDGVAALADGDEEGKAKLARALDKIEAEEEFEASEDYV